PGPRARERACAVLWGPWCSNAPGLPGRRGARRSYTLTPGSPGPARSPTSMCPCAPGTDIAFLGGIINHVLANEKFFREYVVAYTNAAAILTEDYADTEDLDGVFSGLDTDSRSYDFHTWQYEGLEVQAASGERDKEYEAALLGIGVASYTAALISDTAVPAWHDG